MFTLPETVTIGESSHEVVIEPRLVTHQMFGQLVRTKGRIEIAPDMTPFMTEVTLWHECLHEILCQAGQQKIDERIIGALAYGVPRLIRDNPGLVVKE